MGRLSKEHHDMQKKQLRFLLEQETVQKRLKICQTLLESILKTRSGNRKNKYKEELKSVHEFLCVKANDHDELKQKYKELEKKYEHSQRKNSDLSDRNVRLEMSQRK